MKTGSGLSALALAFVLAGCVSPGKPTESAAARCVTGESMMQTTLYFGLNRPDGPAISAGEWQAFVDGEVTPRFTEGLSVFDAKGQWLGNDGVLARENSKALLLIHAADAANETKIEALRSGYKQRFRQDSVMRVDAPVCVAF
ncbi:MULTISPECIES: DUF3574 domain-containing protein [Brenneria]|uniref:DUF3574 domain-containing protein n=1 Tax=Brenneria nigrifluens DSM 30175 = ATCC 13028 TaxID=1121120 RepID=A0A2U1UNN2_9GAMM|nr:MULTISPECIES: DUF3574 domain-containing protein [Brenneria]EHD19614.1 hypothetical protein BrE312_0154 [Brenneria sp. EniD312]PWC23285.1 DUF3574 domain-containing protein [Brenneria nigrifluens DSM 30175 = ATCC 13028]QCR02881.1 DUF3574 domain-containing protein [Brenneria nigrifluens DSM 30175 = ATCC 13028]